VTILRQCDRCDGIIDGRDHSIFDFGSFLSFCSPCWKEIGDQFKAMLSNRAKKKL
jgi:hypothetical protein